MPLRRKRPLPPWLVGAPEDEDDIAEPNEADKAESTVVKEKVKPAICDHLSQEAKKPVVNSLQHKQLQNQPCIDAATIIEMTYPLYSFKGSIVYSYNKDECNILCEEMLSELNITEETVVGFDMEWPVVYERGKQGKTALVQIAPSINKCYLFHISCMPKFPVMLKKLIECDSVKKVGLNIANDFWKLGTDFDIGARDIIKSSSIELKTLANEKLKSAENWSLEGLSKNVLRQRLNKDPNVRKCDWSEFPLPDEQQKYAASDAVVSLMLYLKLNSMGKTNKT